MKNEVLDEVLAKKKKEIAVAVQSLTAEQLETDIQFVDSYTVIPDFLQLAYKMATEINRTIRIPVLDNGEHTVGEAIEIIIDCSD